MKITRVLSFAEYNQLQEDAIKSGFYRNDRRVFVPGMAWYEPYYFDAVGDYARYLAEHPDAGFNPSPMIPAERKGELGFLSVHYWRDWADKRAPICIVCPNGEQWQCDRKSSNGDGWRVTGDLPNITCEPSIVVTGYHGYLRNGEFTADLEGRGPNGTVRQ